MRIRKTGALKISLLGILSVIFVEGFAGLLTGSLALVSDAAHAGFDTLSTLILLVATTLSLRPADEDHTYGHGKIEALGALVGGIVLFILASIIVVLAALRLNIENGVRPGFVGYGAAGYTLGIDILRMAVLTAALRTGSLTVKADLYHAVSDFASTSLVFLALGLATLGYPIGDTAVSLILAGLLSYLSLRLVHSASLDLSDAVSGKLVRSIMSEIHMVDGVLRCKELRVRRVGEVTYVDVVIAISPTMEFSDAHTIASRVEVNLERFLRKASVMVHVEPVDWEIPVERQIRTLTRKVEGAQGIHNVSVTRTGEGLYVTLHVQVDPCLDLDRAHRIAESVERGIQESIRRVKQVTVHLEPSPPEAATGAIVDDKAIADVIRDVIRNYPQVAQISSLAIYLSGERLRINIHCVFAGDESISKVHEFVSEIEDRIRRKFSTALVTIHPEPPSKG